MARNLRGPAASTDTWPLDGHITPFELTVANEDAYYMHVAIRRAAAASRAETAALVADRHEAPDGEKRKVDTEVTVGERKETGGRRAADVKRDGGGDTNGEVGGVETEGVGEKQEKGKGTVVERNKLGGERGAKEAAAVAAYAASSAALLFSRGSVHEEECLLRDSLSAFRAQRKEQALR